MKRPLRIGNASGFYGDRFDAMREMLEGGPLDVLTGDYLAELTMLILGRDRSRHPELGYAKTFLRQLEECLELAKARGVRIVTNAGGVNPAGLAAAIRALAGRKGLDVRVAHVEGDDLLPDAHALGFGDAITANAYLGAFGIAACLNAGADVVVTGRVTDASLVVGPAAAHFGWRSDAWDALAGAVVAGHVLECGAQATGGNFAFFREVFSPTDTRPPGFPIAEIDEDGSCVITKHPGSGGKVTVETVLAQIVYEVTGPRYAGPDVTTRFDTIALTQVGDDRVRITGATGEPPPPTLKVCVNRRGGYKNDVTFLVVGLDVDEKIALLRAQLEAALGDQRPSELAFTVLENDRDDPASEEAASALVRVVAKDADAARVGRAFTAAAVGLSVSSYPGFAALSPPKDASFYGVYEPAFVDAGAVQHVAVLHDGTRVHVGPSPTTRPLPPDNAEEASIRGPASPDAAARAEARAYGPTVRGPLGRLVGARSGDKGGTANLGVWVRRPDAFPWLVETLTLERLRQLLPECAPFPIARHVFPRLAAMNFVIDGLLGEGVASSTRFDPQAKGLGEWLRARHEDLPTAFFEPLGVGRSGAGGE
jgi:hypothetical protein